MSDGAMSSNQSGEGANTSTNTQTTTQSTETNTNQTNTDNTQVQNQQTEQNQAKDDFDSLYDEKKETNQNQSVIPEKYVFTNENGEAYSDDDVSEFSNFVRDVGLSQEQATKVFNAYVADIKQLKQDFDNAQINSQAEQKKAWKQAVMSDAEIGGQNFETTKANISKVMNTYATPELRQYLNQSGLGYNPAFIKFVATIGKNLASDNQFIGGSTAPRAETEQERAKRMYPNTPEVWGGQ